MDGHIDAYVQLDVTEHYDRSDNPDKSEHSDPSDKTLFSIVLNSHSFANGNTIQNTGD